VDLQVAYYAQHLARDVAQGDGELARLEPGAEQLVMAWVNALGAKIDESQGRIGIPMRQAVNWVAHRYGLDQRLVRILVARFAGEVYRYLNFPSCRRAVRDAVMAEICAYSPDIIIAHSLGSVVAYEALCNYPSKDLRVELLLTVGSPLAMPDVIFEKLEPTPNEGTGQRPPGVNRWVNIADPADFIAVPRWLHLWFDGVGGDLEASIGTFDFHRVSGYLSCSATAGLLASYVDLS
jgi:pimeloyl-ACP methyl ester carboxylesterase